MQPAAIIAVVVKAQGVGPTNAQLRTVQANLEKTDAAGIAMGKNLQKSGKMMTSAGQAMTKALTVPILAVGTASTVMALNFNRDMSLIQTQAGASAKETHYFKKEILALGGAVKFGPEQLSQALFRVRSAGFKGREGMNVLNEGVKLATVGNSDLEMTTKALTGAAKSLDIHGSKAFRHLAAEMNAAVGTGDMRMEELQSALSTGVLPVFVAAGMTFRDYASALTVMTDRNVPAQMASTRLRTAITMLVPHTEKAEEALAGVGIESEKLATIMRSKGLPQAIAYLAEHLDQFSKNKQNRIMIEAFGGAKSSATIEMLVENYKELFLKQKLVGEGIGKYNKEVKTADHNPLVELQKAWGAIQTDLVKIGEVIVPIVVPAFLKVADSVSKVVDGFSKLSPSTQKSIVYMAMIAAAIGPVLRIMGWLTTETGTLVAWLARNNLALGQNASEASAAAAANTELAASLVEVSGAQQELLIANSSGAVTGSVPVGVGAAPEAETAATRGMAGRMAGGLAAMLPAALAAVGIGNIISTAVSGDTKGVIWKSGGAIAGAIAGGIAGGLPGALIGAGLGSIVGGELAKLFGGKSLTPLQETIHHQMEHAAEVTKSQHKAVKHLHQSHENLDSAEKRAKQTTEHVADAHHRLNQVIHQFGPASRQARTAMHELTILEHKNAMAAKGVEHAHRLSGHALKLYRHETMEVVHAEKVRIPPLQQQIAHLNKKIHAEEEAGHKGHHYWELMHQVVKKEEEEGTIRTKIQHKVAEAAQVAGKKFAHSLSNISTEQAALGRHFHGIQIGARHVKESMEEFATKGALSNKHFISSSYMARTKFKEDAEAISSATGIATDKIESRLAHALEKMGVAAVGFHVKNSGSKKGGAGGHKGKHATGGMVVPGNTSGDKVHMSALVEPGEVVHVLNKNAVGDMHKLGALEALNRMKPRYQGKFAEGGTWRGIGRGGLHEGIIKVAEDVMSHYGGLSVTSTTGGTHVSDSLHYLGEAVDIAGGTKEMYSASQWIKKSGLYKQLAEGIHNPNLSVSEGQFVPPSFYAEVWAEHANHIHLGVTHAVGKIMEQALAPVLQGVEITGPDGTLKQMGNAAVKDTELAAKKYLKAHTPKNKFGGAGGSVGGVSLKGVSGSVAAQAAEIAKRAHAEYVPTLALFEALWAESSMGTTAPGNVLEALEPYTKIRPAAQEISGFLTGHPEWTGKNAIEEHRKNPELPANAIAQLVQASGVGEGNEGRANYLVQKNAAIATMKQFGLFTGGGGAKTSMLMKKGDSKKQEKKGAISKGMGNILKGLRKGEHLPKFQGKLKRLGRRINALGLSDKQLHRLKHLQDLTGDVSQYEEAASNASALTISDEEGNITQGVFRGRTEGDWLNQQLGALLRLRGAVVKEYNTDSPQLPFVKKLAREANARLREVRKAIRKAEEEKKLMEKQIKTIEKAENTKKHELEKEINQLEHTIAEARRNVPPSTKKTKGAHEAAENRINELEKIKEAKSTALSHSGSDSTKEITELHKKIHKIEADQKGRGRVESALTGTIIPDLTSKKESIAQLLQGMLGESGEIEGRGKHITFTGLKALQGAGIGLGEIGNPPVLGTVGGEIFTVQNRLREIAEEAKKVQTPASEAAEDEIAKQEAEEWKKRFIVSQYQYNVLKGFPSVNQLAYPFAGAFAKGGVLMAEVGEKGREIIAAPQGSRVVSKGEVDRAVRSGGGATHMNFEEINFHEAEGKVTGRMNGQDFEADVKTVTRKQGRKAATPSPGSRRRK